MIYDVDVMTTYQSTSIPLGVSMKYLIAVLFAVALLVPAKEAHAQWTLGGGLQFLEGAGVAVNIYNNTDNLYKNTRGGGDIGYYFVEDGTLLEIAANAHYFFLKKEDISGYAIVGSTALFYMGNNIAGTVSGILNLGAGAEYKLGFGSAYGEARYLIGGAAILGINAGVRITL
jgi:hypothetical protein